MRCLKKNMQKLYYATYAGEVVVYKKDESGEVIYVDDGTGNKEPVEAGTKPGYSEPILLNANISVSGGESEMAEYGFENGDYEAVLVTTDKSLPICETSRIWHDTEPQTDENGHALGDSADYSVLAVKPSLNSVKYLLKRLPKGSAGNAD